jgi:hypothetical protein
LEPNALTQLADLYEKAGRMKEAESCRERANKLWAVVDPASARVQNRIPPATIPAQWVDLPGAPAAAEYREVGGVNQTVLVNKSSKGIEMGCSAASPSRTIKRRARCMVSSELAETMEV